MFLASWLRNPTYFLLWYWRSYLLWDIADDKILLSKHYPIISFLYAAIVEKIVSSLPFDFSKAFLNCGSLFQYHCKTVSICNYDYYPSKRVFYLLSAWLTKCLMTRLQESDGHRYTVCKARVGDRMPIIVIVKKGKRSELVLRESLKTPNKHDMK